jgi:uncharacterized membrane protein
LGLEASGNLEPTFSGLSWYCEGQHFRQIPDDKEDSMRIVVFAFLIGIVAGLRSMTAPAVVSWAARLGLLSIGDTWLAFFGFRWTPLILSITALGELIGDKLPFTPSRKAPIPFVGRIISGALCGGAIGAARGNLYVGMVCGAIGAVAGTLGGYSARMRLVRAFDSRDFPVAVLEDLVAIAAGVAVVTFTR